MSEAVEILGDEDAVRKLAPQWRALAEQRANAFITPEWYLAALAAYGDESEPWAVAVRDQAGELIGVLPLVRSSGPRATIRFAGASLGDVFHPAAAEGEPEEAVARAAAAELVRAERGWRSLLLENVPAEAAWLGALPGEGLRATPIAHRDEVLPGIPLAGRDWAGYLAGRSRNFRSQVGRKLRRLEREGEVRFRRADDPGKLEEDLATFFALHESRWANRGGSQALTERSRAFHGHFAASALERGWLRLWFLELDGEAIAAWYGWLVGGRYAYYLAGFDEAFGEHSVGQSLLAHTIEQAFAEGADEYDLLLGGEEYKARFAETSREVRTVAITRAWSPARTAIRAESLARRVTEGLPDGVRDGIKRPLGAITRRLPSRVER